MQRNEQEVTKVVSLVKTGTVNMTLIVYVGMEIIYPFDYTSYLKYCNV